MSITHVFSSLFYIPIYLNISSRLDRQWLFFRVFNKTETKQKQNLNVWKTLPFNKKSSIFISKRLEKRIKQNEQTEIKEINKMSKFVEANEKIAKSVVDGYKKIENGVVDGYKKIENGVVDGFSKVVDKCSSVMLDEEGNLKTGKVGDKVVSGYKKIEDKFVNAFLAKEGETTEEAKARIKAEQDARDAKMKDDAEKRAADQKARVDASIAASKSAGKRN
jgi:hypothetical protein